MTTLFISDLHLDERKPETTELLLQFLHTQACHASALYILGDLFEYWLGDDIPGRCGQQVATALADLKCNGVNCYLIHGNRDFLMRSAYARSAGVTLLPQMHVIDLDGERVLLLHGDSLCTDDVRYQQFRTLVRNPAWQDDFLGKSPAQRLRLARQARTASAGHTDSIASEIMDVNQTEVISVMRYHGVNKMIHGHTHRPAIHALEIDGAPAQRIVLGDWHSEMSVLRVQAGRYDLSASCLTNTSAVLPSRAV